MVAVTTLPFLIRMAGCCTWRRRSHSARFLLAMRGDCIEATATNWRARRSLFDRLLGRFIYRVLFDKFV
jgi:hypothetical protein